MNTRPMALRLASGSSMPASAESLESSDTTQRAEIDAKERDDGNEIASKEDSNQCGHLYDAKRFGSQQHLLDLLMRQGEEDQPLLKLIDKLG